MKNSERQENLTSKLNLLESRIAELEKELTLKENQLKDLKVEMRYGADELIKSHATLNSIFEGPENIIAFSLDSNYKYIFFNEAHSQTMKNIWGVDIEIGNSMLDYIFNLEDRNKAKSNFDRALSGENFIELEDYGEETLSRRYWEDIYNPIQSGNEIIGFTVFCIDITERKKAEDALILAKEEWEHTFDAVPDLIAIFGNDFKIIRINKAMADSLNVDPEEAVGLHCYEVVHGSEQPPSFCPLHKLYNDGQEHTEEVHEDLIGGDFIVSVSPLHDSGGKLIGSVHVARDITERKRIEEALKESENKFRSIFNKANDMISLNLMKDEGMPGRFLEVNDVASERLGYTRDELLKMSPPEIVTPEKRPEMPKNAVKLLEEGHNTFEIVHITKEGNRIPVEVNNHLIDYQGQEVCLAISRDITDRKKVEKALQESEEKYRSIFENVQDIYYQTDIDGKIVEASPSVERYSSFSREDLIGKSVDLIYFSPGERIKFLKELKKKGEVFDFEVKLKDKDGSLFYASTNAHFIYDSDKRPIGVEGSLRDINKRKKAEEELRLSEIRLSNAMNLADLANWELDPYNQMFLFNDRFYGMLGTTAENEGGYHMPIEYYIKEYVHPEDIQFISEGMKNSLNIRQPTFGTQFEHRIIRKDGKTRCVAIHIQVNPATDSKKAYIYGTVQDITDLKMAEEKLKESLSEKEMLLKEIHHRVKNNLMIISSLLNLQSGYLKDEESKGLFQESENRARSMALIHERLYQSTDLKNIDFGEYIETLVNELFLNYTDGSGRINLKINKEEIGMDINTAIPLSLIVNELVTNSLKHAFPEDRTGDIEIDFHSKDDKYELIVKDNGVGLPEDLDYTRTDSLGMQLVTSLTAQIDGEIEMERTEGTTFKIILPKKEI
ncbi:MAG: PAS domain S-box protein [Methanobacterium sp.]|nr:PAS domain S-box protein [Methanobacterium sp.]